MPYNLGLRSTSYDKRLQSLRSVESVHVRFCRRLRGPQRRGWGLDNPLVYGRWLGSRWRCGRLFTADGEVANQIEAVEVIEMDPGLSGMLILGGHLADRFAHFLARRTHSLIRSHTPQFCS